MLLEEKHLKPDLKRKKDEKNMSLGNGMLRVAEYFVVRATDTIGLATTVNEMLQHGWQPFGAPSFVGGSNWVQAVVKYQSDEVTFE